MLTSHFQRATFHPESIFHRSLAFAVIGLALAMVGCGPPHHHAAYPPESHSNHDAEMFNDRGNGYVLKHEYKLAVHNYTEAIRFDRNYAEAYCNRGSVHVQTGGADLAIGDLDEAIRIKPDFGRAFYLRGQAWELKGDTKLAKDDFERAKQLGFAPRERL